MRIRTDLTGEEIKLIRDTAQEMLVSDLNQDRSYLWDFVANHLGQFQSDLQLLLETISSEADMYEELLGFDPLEDEKLW